MREIGNHLQMFLKIPTIGIKLNKLCLIQTAKYQGAINIDEVYV